MPGLISIIVPAYNAEKYLENCLKSLLNQTYQKLEIIVVNDGSSDRTREILDAYDAKHRRIVAIHQENGGVSAARNAGLNVATGEYITFCDADDWMDPTTFECALRYIQNYRVDAVGFNLTMHNEDTGTETLRDRSLVTGKYNQAAMVKYAFGIKGKKERVTTCFLSINNKLFKASALFHKDGSPIRFRQNMRYLEDGLFLVEVMQNIQSFYYDSRGLSFRRIHDDSAMAIKDNTVLINNMLDGYEAILKTDFLASNAAICSYGIDACKRAAVHYVRQCITTDEIPLALSIRERFSHDEAFQAQIDKLLAKAVDNH